MLTNLPSPDVDNKIQWRYLEATKPILPTYAGGNDIDIANWLTVYKWSAPQTLYQIPSPPTSYAYGGGMHPGYFAATDITNGGTDMLLSWTWPNGQSAASLGGGYSIQTAKITWA